MVKRRHYSDEERAACLAALAANGGNVGKTARQLGMPEATIRRWHTGERRPGQVSEQKKGDMAAALEAVAWQLLESLPAKVSAASLAQTSTAMGIAIDKARLLRGQPTAISDNTHRLDELTDDEVEQRIAELEARLPRPDRGVRPSPGPEVPG